MTSRSWTGICGLLCWQGYDKDPGGFKKLMLCEIMREFNCKASSTWSVCGRESDDGFTHGHSSPGMKQETAQQDYIIGLARRDDEMHIHNEERIWATWNHYSISARIQEEGRTNNFKKGMKKKSGLDGKLKTEGETVAFKKRVEKNEGTEDDLDIIRRNMATAAGKVVRHTKAEREKITHNEHTRECQTT